MEGAQSIIDDAVSAFGTVDILINNAGILRDKSFKNMDMADWDIVMDVHLNGSGYVTRAAWPSCLRNATEELSSPALPLGYSEISDKQTTVRQNGHAGHHERACN